MFVDDGMRTPENGGYWFDDGLSLLYDYAGDSYELAVGGNGLTWNGSSLTSGTLVAIEQSLIDSSGYDLPAYQVTDFAVSAASFSLSGQRERRPSGANPYGRGCLERVNRSDRGHCL